MVPKAENHGSLYCKYLGMILKTVGITKHCFLVTFFDVGQTKKYFLCKHCFWKNIVIEVLFPTRVCQRLENQETFVKNIFVCSVNSNKLLNYMQALVIESNLVPRLLPLTLLPSWRAWERGWLATCALRTCFSYFIFFLYCNSFLFDVLSHLGII